jgi:uracil-DNA glycosylase
MPEGFFHKEQIDPACGGDCKLNRECRSPKMPVTGQGRMRILVVAEAPGNQEDRQNTQLIGPAGQVLRDALADFGVDLDRDCRKTNAVRCRPPENRKPTAVEIVSCQPHIWKEIREHQPKLILLLGQVALESFMLGKFKKATGTIGRWRGFVIPDQKVQAWVCPMFHPSYILRSKEGRAIRGKAEPLLSVEERTFTADLEKALSCLHKPFPVAPVPEIKFHDFPEIPSFSEAIISIDYETTGLRPWERKDHRIVSCAFGWESGASAFPVSLESLDYLKRVLTDKSVRKIAHNIKFEHQWAVQTLGVKTQGWLWDTMLTAHMIDNRRNICKLKHQTYLNFGVEDWSGGMDFGDEDDEELNALGDRELTEEDLHYNALDAFWAFQLAQKQMGLFK